MRLENVLIEPLVTEKGSMERAFGAYLFKVDKKATKVDIRIAVEKMFKVKVKKVNTLNVDGKKKIMGRSIGRTASWKKAYVTLLPGQKIDQLEIT